MPAAIAERRMVSVLFADLVGFTRIAEGRDPEETRELLARYFETAREIIERYAGSVEKFIGDAVMAVWGSPVAQEDDAERAVRAALDLVAAIPSLGPGIEARAGVLTGEAVVTLGASNQGMVAGDLVNTASRLQAAAAPGSVLVGETTRRTAGPAIAFEPAGEQVLKGKSLPVPAFRALRVVAELGGRNRSETLEAPFVGRDDELRLLKDLFHATTREGRARLVSVIGPAGIGKTRLAWEFSKYIDGLAEAVWWHVGRSPAYGEGISFWALGEMIRGRCGLLETDDETTTRAQVAAMLREHLPDEAERRWVEGAVLALLGVGGATTASAELFGAWRTLFERLSLSGTVALVFEDFNNADPGLIDFVDHLLEWSRGHPIYVLTLARPELLERRPDWHAKRNFASVSLEPLTDAAILELLGGLVPGLPESAVRSIVARADGMPLYAVETVRMLLAEGKLELREERYVPVGDLADLAVPATLTSLIASRLDGLDAADRALVQDAAVLGQSFTRAGLAAVSGVAEDRLEPHLRALVRREILTQTVDPRSPELGRFSFVQGLIREVAYNTLARADRRARHLAAARFFETLGSDELAGALAGHYLDAHRNASPGADAEALAGQARVALRAAAERAISLGSYEQAARFCEEALTVTEDPGVRADLLERAGSSWSKAAHHEAGSARLREAIDLHSAAGDRRATARAIASLARSLVSAHQTDDARALLEHAVDEFADLEGEPEGVALRVVFARAAMAGEHYAQAVALADEALAVGERLDLPQLVAQALMARGAALETLGRPYEGSATIRAGIELAEANGASEDALIGRVAHMASTGAGDPVAALEMGRAGLVEARRLGERARAIAFAGNAADAARWTGDWSLALVELDSFLEGDLDGEDRIWLIETELVLRAWRGEHIEVQAAELRDLYGRVAPDWREVGRSDMEACLRLADGRLAEARAAAHELARLSPLNAPTAFVVAARAAVWARDAAALREDLDAMDAIGLRGPVMRLRQSAFRAGLAALEGRPSEARALYAEAYRGLLDRGISFEAALVAIDMATVLGSDDPDAVTVMADARLVLERLGALPFLERLDAVERLDPEEAEPPARGRGSAGREVLSPR
jgi:class 3 adenylate cyclase/tetratricopeptide (TPR) repeat protein